ncbi:hypothetical protein ARMGADRAFT_1035376 [Armillaria gallica]|uniref:Uncharacterized protein n=1 Tax=Armillaria gallica TaxID=47427 RepID=A0A2H3DGB2_ARMGA|nr:hypothetical protein ARMGADRAFT_1035376 [Armillaria gallica]
MSRRTHSCCYAFYNLEPMGDGCDGEYRAAEMSWTGVLARLASTNMIHTEDNIVKYYWGMLDGRKKRYIPAKPQSFRLGDIAEVQCSVVFMKSKGGSVKMKLILRALALVNCEHAMNTDREQKRDTEHKGYGHGTQKVKRKVRFKYSDEDEEEQPTQKCWEGNEQKATEENGGLQMED